MKFFFLFTILYFIGLVHASGWPGNCKFQIANQEFDFNGLKNKYSSQDYDFYYTPKKWNFYMNICRPILYNCFTTDVAMCQVWDANLCTKDGTGCASLGSATSIQAVNGTKPGDNGYGISFIFTGGAANRQSALDFSCSYNGGDGLPQFESQTSNFYRLSWQSSYACPTSTNGIPRGGGGISGGWVFIIILLVGSFVYFVGGLLFLKFVKKQEGTDLIPNKEFWLEVPGFIKDGALFVGHGFKKEGYQQM